MKKRFLNQLEVHWMSTYEEGRSFRVLMSRNGYYVNFLKLLQMSKNQNLQHQMF